MIEILLTVIILALLGYHAWYTHEVAKEKKELVDALIARSAVELRDLRLAQNTQIKVDKPKQDNMIPMEEVDDETLIKLSREQYGDQ